MRRERLPLTSRPFDGMIASLDLAENDFAIPRDLTPFWNAGLCYAISEQEMQVILDTASELHFMYLDAVQYVLSEDMLSVFGLPSFLHDPIVSSWEDGALALLGRIDLCFRPDNPPVLLNYFTDMPSGLIEAALWQRRWLKSVCPYKAQFNEIQQSLQERWKVIAADVSSPIVFLNLARQMDSYGIFLMTTANQAGCLVTSASCDGLMWDIGEGLLMNGDGEVIDIAVETCGWLNLLSHCDHVTLSSLLMSGCHLVEPPWRILMGHVGMLAILWEIFEGHSALCPASFAPGDIEGSYDRIPFPQLAPLSSGIQVYHQGISDEGSYGMSGYVYRSHIGLPRFDDENGDDFFVVQVWMVGDEPAGICIYESKDVTIGGGGRFVPHYIG